MVTTTASANTKTGIKSKISGIRKKLANLAWEASVIAADAYGSLETYGLAVSESEAALKAFQVEYDGIKESLKRVVDIENELTGEVMGSYTVQDPMSAKQRYDLIAKYTDPAQHAVFFGKIAGIHVLKNFVTLFGRRIYSKIITNRWIGKKNLKYGEFTLKIDNPKTKHNINGITTLDNISPEDSAGPDEKDPCVGIYDNMMESMRQAGMGLIPGKESNLNPGFSDAHGNVGKWEHSYKKPWKRFRVFTTRSKNHRVRDDDTQIVKCPTLTWEVDDISCIIGPDGKLRESVAILTKQALRRLRKKMSGKSFITGFYQKKKEKKAYPVYRVVEGSGPEEGGTFAVPDTRYDPVVSKTPDEKPEYTFLEITPDEETNAWRGKPIIRIVINKNSKKNKPWKDYPSILPTQRLNSIHLGSGDGELNPYTFEINTFNDLVDYIAAVDFKDSDGSKIDISSYSTTGHLIQHEKLAHVYVTALKLLHQKKKLDKIPTDPQQRRYNIVNDGGQNVLNYFELTNDIVSDTFEEAFERLDKRYDLYEKTARGVKYASAISTLFFTGWGTILGAGPITDLIVKPLLLQSDPNYVVPEGTYPVGEELPLRPEDIESEGNLPFKMKLLYDSYKYFTLAIDSFCYCCAAALTQRYYKYSNSVKKFDRNPICMIDVKK